MSVSRWVGLDVHARETACAVFDQATGEVDTLKVSGRPEVALAFLQGLERPFVAVYEAGPTGYGLARAAADRGFDVRVCSPGGTPKRPNDRIKTDTRDALRLARLLAAGELRSVRVPRPEEEHLRDLVRAREAVRVDLARVRHRIGKLLLRRGIYYRKGGRAWTGEHLAWLRSLSFADRPSELVFDDLLHGHDVLLERRERLDGALAVAAAESSWADTIARLRCLRGVETLTAVGLCAEIGDFGRFEHPRYLGAYLGLVPSESSSGDRRRQGSITKTGSTHARRLLIEASWHYRTKLGGRSAVHRRQRGADPRAVEIAQRANRRLHGRWVRLERERKKRSTIVAVAVARELTTFCWELGVMT